MTNDAEAGPPRVFLSYSRADQPKVAKLAAALEARGISLWWDRALEGGAAFADVIEAELARADRCIVAWSKSAAQSHWVRDEAGWARDRGRLVPVRLDSSEPPLGFRQVQAIDLSHWHGRADAPEIDALVSAIGQPAAAPAKAPRRRLPVAAIAGVVALLLAGLGYAGWRQFGAAGPEAPAAAPKATAAAVAVLPFADMSARRDQAYFADGIAEEITMRLARDGRLKVLGRATAASLKDRAADMAFIRGTLGVGHLLEGSVREAEGRLRIAVRLVDTRDGAERWAETYDRKSGDIFAVQDEVAAAVAQRLALDLSAGPGAAASPDNPHRVTSPENYRRYLLGRSLLRERTPTSIQRASAILNEVVKNDPDFAPGHASAGEAYGLLYSYGLLPSAEAGARMSAATERALALDPSLGTAWLMRAFHAGMAGRFEDAVRLARRAVELDPDNPDVLGPASGVLVAWLVPGAVPEALGWAEKAVTLDPLLIQPQIALQNIYWLAQDATAARTALARFEAVSVRDDARHRLSILNAVNFESPVEVIRRYRARQATTVTGPIRGGHAWAFASLQDRDSLREELNTPLDYPEEQALVQGLRSYDAFLARSDAGLTKTEFATGVMLVKGTLGRHAELVAFLRKTFPGSRVPDLGVEPLSTQALAHAASAFAAIGDQATADLYLSAARGQLKRMQEAGVAPEVLALSAATIEMAAGRRADAVRHLQISSRLKGQLQNFCYFPDWLAAQPFWAPLRSEPGYAEVLDHCRKLINTQRAELGLPPAALP